MYKKQAARWPRFIAAVATSILPGALYSWSYFRDDIGKLFPSWSAGDLSLIFSIQNITVCFAILAAGFLLKRISNRIMLFIAATLLLIGLTLFSFIPEERPDIALVMAVISFSGIAAAAVGIVAAAAFPLYTQWAPDHPGKLIGFMALTTSCTPIAAGAVCSALIPVIGVLPTVRWLGIVIAAIVYLTLPLARPPGPDDKLPPEQVRAENPEQRDFSPGEMMRMPSFWMLFIFNAVIRTSGLIIIDFGGSIAIYFGMAAILGLLHSPSTGIANIVGGFLADRLKTSRFLILAGGMLLLGVILLLSGNAAGIPMLAIAGLLVGGFSYGTCTIICSSSVRNLYGLKYFAQNYAIIQMAILLASGGGYIAGNLLDLGNGNYQGVFLLLLGFAIVGIACGTCMEIVMKRRSHNTG